MRPIQRCLLSIAGAAIILILVPIMVQADVPQLINFQGKLIEDDLAVTGFRTMTFSLWDSDTGDSPTSGIWSETQLSVEIVEGIYNVQLGSANPIPSDLYTYDQLYLQIDIIHPTEGSRRLSPLLEFTSTVFALKAGDSDLLDGKTANAYAQNVHNHNGSDINAGVVADAYIADTIARDSEITWGNLDGVPADFVDGVDNTGVTEETDPTVPVSVKDGIAWTEIANRPAGLDDGDQVGLTSESDPQVRVNSVNRIPKWDGSALVTGSIYDNGKIGIVISNPESKLHISGGSWDLVNTEGDFKIGSATHRLKMGVAVGGFGAGSATIRAQGGVNSLHLGTGESNVISIIESNVGIGTAPSEKLTVAGTIAGRSDTVYGVYGYSNGVGIHAQGGILAGEFVGDVEIEGDLFVNRIEYQAPRTHYYSVGDGNFHSGSGETYRTSIGYGGSYIFDTGAGWLDAGLHLPQGAVIQRFKVITDDNATGNLSVSIDRRAHTSGAFATLASISTSGTPGIQTQTDTSIQNPTIDNNTYAYHVRVYCVNWPGTSSLKIKGAVVEYTIDEAI